MYEGCTFEEAFNNACADVPQSDHDIRWIGDGNLTLEEILNEKPEAPDTPKGISNGKIKKEYVFNTSTTDPNGDQVYYEWNWDDDTTTDWQGPYPSGEQINATHTWETEGGDYEIKVRAKDIHGEMSNWSEPLTITIENQAPTPPDTPEGPSEIKRWRENTYRATTTDPEGQRIRYIFSWGDGTTTTTDYVASGETIEVNHTWDTTGSYEIKVKAQDEGNEESNWSEPLPITVPYMGEGPLWHVLELFHQWLGSILGGAMP